MRNKRVWAAVLALALLFTLTACGGKDAAPGPTDTETTEPTPTPDPAAALVGTWTNADGVGLKFTSDGTAPCPGLA